MAPVERQSRVIFNAQVTPELDAHLNSGYVEFKSTLLPFVGNIPR